MNSARCHAIAVALIASASAVHAGDSGPTAASSGIAVPSRVLTLHHDPQFILQAVARRLGIRLRREIPAPEVLLESKTSLSRLQATVERHWGFQPQVFVSTFVPTTNEIYLIDDARVYERREGTLDDALAHEFVHYLQAKYGKAMLQTDWAEFEAVAVQTWFRAEHTGPKLVAADARSAR
jgi:hypothetical protein